MPNKPFQYTLHAIGGYSVSFGLKFYNFQNFQREIRVYGTAT